MKKLQFVLFVAILNLHFTCKKDVILLAGTSISLELKQEVNSEQVERGNIIEFLVKNNVTVGGQVVITAGSSAEGIVKDVVKLCRGCNANCAKVTITVENVQTVDGQRIYLRSIPHSETTDCKGWKPAVVKIGTAVSAKVLNNATIAI
ncbi:MAG: hypothetical protein HC892_03640 [Saprospiraceae bacterium]|nr:hypothetical protein [Saprospiraceae bacterium]